MYEISIHMGHLERSFFQLDVSYSAHPLRMCHLFKSSLCGTSMSFDDQDQYLTESTIVDGGEIK